MCFFLLPFAMNDGLGVAEDGGDIRAARTFDVHEIRVGSLNESF